MTSFIIMFTFAFKGINARVLEGLCCVVKTLTSLHVLSLCLIMKNVPCVYPSICSFLADFLRIIFLFFFFFFFSSSCTIVVT